MRPDQPSPGRAAPRDRAIDCARGYAVLMVIACHLAYSFPGLPYPVKRVVTSGWFGVQLFFLMSCFTLLLSWHRELASTGRVDRTAFFVRRWFRIAPAYYAAGLLYFWLKPPPGGLDLGHAALAAAFVNAWHPAWTSTLPGGWVVVPGGWSISVEFAFYAIFPLFAALVTSLPRALLALALSIAAGTIADLAVRDSLAAAYDPVSVGNFLFFWPPNQASVFALGGVLFFALRGRHVRVPQRYSTALAGLSIAAFATLTWLPLGHFLGDWPPVPAGLAACLPLMGFAAALLAGSGLFVRAGVAAMGQVSFSAYLLHFCVLGLFDACPGILHVHATSWAAILAYGSGFLLTVPLTYAAAWVSFRLIERPMIDLGRQLIARSSRQPRPA